MRAEVKASRGEVARGERPDREEVLRKRAERKLLKRMRKSGVGEGGRRNVHKKGRDCRRFCMRVAYDGRTYYGWQKQCVPGRKRKRARLGADSAGNTKGAIESDGAGGSGDHLSGGVGNKSGTCNESNTYDISNVDIEKNSDTDAHGKLGRVDLFPTIQGTLERCLRPVLNQNARFIASGRTDSRVSARAQMVQFDANLNGLYEHVEPPMAAPPTDAPSTKEDHDAILSQLLPPLLRKFNDALPGSIRVLSLSRAPKDFNVMRPNWKTYVYKFTPLRESGISLRAWCEDVLCPSEHRGHLKWKKVRSGSGDRYQPAAVATNRDHLTPSESSFKLALPLDSTSMSSVAASYVGTHDFAGFQSKGGRKSTTRTVHACTVSEITKDIGEDEYEKWLQLTITGSGFLMHMVRIIAGTLLEVGCGIRTIADAIRPLKTLSRKDAGPTLPGAQLCLEYVHYDQLSDDTGSKVETR